MALSRMALGRADIRVGMHGLVGGGRLLRSQLPLMRHPADEVVVLDTFLGLYRGNSAFRGIGVETLLSTGTYESFPSRGI